MSMSDLFQDTKHLKSFAAGQIIFTEGEQGEVMYLVKQGRVQVLVGGRVVDTIGPGAIVGEMALIETKARSATLDRQNAMRIADDRSRQFPRSDTARSFLQLGSDARARESFAAHGRAYLALVLFASDT